MSYRSKKKDAVGEEKHFTFDHQTGEITAKSSGVIDFPAGMVLEQAPVGTSAAVGAPQPGPVRMTNRMAQEFMFAPQLSSEFPCNPGFNEINGHWMDYTLESMGKVGGRAALSHNDRESMEFHPFLSWKDKANLKSHFQDRFDEAMWDRVYRESKKIFENRFNVNYVPSYTGYTVDVQTLGKMMQEADDAMQGKGTSYRRGKAPTGPIQSKTQAVTSQMCTCAEPLLMPSLGSGMDSARLWGGRGRLEEEDGYWSD